MTRNESCEQPKICAEIFKSVDEKIKVANHRIDDLEGKTEEINSINNVLVELQLLTKLQREDGIKRDVMIEEFNKNQTEITNTLKVLSDNLSKTDKTVEKLDDKIDKYNEETNIKFGEITQDNSIKLSDIGKKILFGLLCGGVGILATKIFG